MYTYRIAHHRATEDTERTGGNEKHLKQEFAKIAEGAENSGAVQCSLRPLRSSVSCRENKFLHVSYLALPNRNQKPEVKPLINANDR
jgi:hypothetical protein